MWHSWEGTSQGLHNPRQACSILHFGYPYNHWCSTLRIHAAAIPAVGAMLALPGCKSSCTPNAGHPMQASA